MPKVSAFVEMKISIGEQKYLQTDYWLGTQIRAFWMEVQCFTLRPPSPGSRIWAY
jgi:hypothetical protein